MIQFVGNNDHPSEVKRIESWAERINDWRSQGLETVYFGYDQHDYDNYPKVYKKAKEIFASAGLIT